MTQLKCGKGFCGQEIKIEVFGQNAKHYDWNMPDTVHFHSETIVVQLSCHGDASLWHPEENAEFKEKWTVQKKKILANIGRKKMNNKKHKY